ncbi:MAG: NifU N-terminal domain-containing protein [Actinomycetota bacterium]|nr:NifU N-terminal domain-containing protein [Actinomycetota bacterium]MBW3643073.1 NifU N-terminal domain-containing protein [Actinomycetota bacterium]MDP9005576.1 NifU N-terminal domain-containing protein [Actinomycetota bacterium]
MATAVPSPTPNPDATKYTLDVTLPGMVNLASPEAAEAEGDAFAAAVFRAGGVASVFATANFVTVVRQPGAPWEPITAAVQAAAAEHL